MSEDDGRDEGETLGLVTCPCGWSRRGYFSDLHAHQYTHRQERDRDERFKLIEAAVRVILPNVQNETAAWNTWNNLASSDDFRAAIVMIDRERRWEAHEARSQPTDPSKDPVMRYHQMTPAEVLAEANAESGYSSTDSGTAHTAGAS